MRFQKLCRGGGNCTGHDCGNFTEGQPGFFGEPQCDNLMGYIQVGP